MRADLFSVIHDGQAAWPDWISSGQRRRADPLTRSASLAVDTLLTQGWKPDSQTALVVSTSYGAVEATCRFGTSIANFGDAGASPSPFTSSVHNSPAGALGEALSIHGPCTTISQGQHGCTAALRWATMMLAAKRAPNVLLVIGDRHNAWSTQVVRSLSQASWPIGDGVVALVLHADDQRPGRTLSWTPAPTQALHIEAGALSDADRAGLAAWSGAHRCAADLLGRWWPNAALAGVDRELWHSDTPLRVAEVEHGRLETCWFAGWSDT
jgi:hypothetical protein